MRLEWLTEYNYRRCPESAGEIEAWICRDFSPRLDVCVWAEILVTATGNLEGDDFVELSAALRDDTGCFVRVSLDHIKTHDLRSRLAWYESRVLAMLEVGLNVNPGASPTPRAKNPPCPKCGAELRTPSAQQCFRCGADWHPGPAAGIT